MGELRVSQRHGGNLVTRDVHLLAAVAMGFAVLALPATATAFDSKKANKICVDRYNIEKESGTVPAGMPKSKYVSQCTRAMKRNAQLQAELAAQTAEKSGGNELTAGTQHASSTSQPQDKPANVTMPALAPKGE
jgi:hypothetical protein